MKNTFYLQRQNFCRTLWKHTFSFVVAATFAFIFLLMTNSAFAVGGAGNFTAQANEEFLTGTNFALSIQQNRTLTASGVTRADIAFQYADADVPNGANESNFKLNRCAKAINTELAPTSNKVGANTFTLNNVGEFSDWKLGNNLVPTAASVIIGGRVRTDSGRGVPRVSVSLTDAAGNTRYVSTNHFGFYRFTDVPVGATYIFNIRHKQYDFLQPSFPLFVVEERTDINFTAQPKKGGLIYNAFNRNF